MKIYTYIHIMSTLKHVPNDLALVIFLTLLCIPFVLIPPLNESPVRIILGLPLVLFLPGYSLIAALFIRKDDLDGIERIALSVGLSIAITPIKRVLYISRDIIFKKRGSKKDANSIGKDNESCGNY
jgi:uncharacterized membrane protein